MRRKLRLTVIRYVNAPGPRGANAGQMRRKCSINAAHTYGLVHNNSFKMTI